MSHLSSDEQKGTSANERLLEFQCGIALPEPNPEIFSIVQKIWLWLPLILRQSQFPE